ncbi:pyruvate carboxyltransferase [Actinosynnema sp. ALI-1.44]|uniref:LeuA family protein n=1 Tax=Actinosynnema sp. ALI-1.44 TaxID=1933779 RepID=UPI00097C15B8|nr:pyruvate carboxyltransferase [Actinosynnema sp. ALI-1.44]ONI88278.1 pyruvate carboxyltransferase [Actinosynnema sp. ALI-1.44]
MSSEPNLARRVISIYDTTLRDGEQAPGNSMQPEQKLELALNLEALGADVIETGFPSSSSSDFKATRLIAEAVTTARISTLSRADRNDIRVAVEAGGVHNHQVEIMATGSEVHLEHKRGISRAEGVRELVDAVEFTASLGVDDISVGIEDASRGSHGYLRELIEASMAAGATTFAVADTTGCMVPEEYGRLIAAVREWVPAGMVVSTHCHEDLGLGLANTLAGVRNGADEVQVTLGGIGERAGNTSLEEFVAVLAYKSEEIGASTRIRSEGLYEAYQLLASIISVTPPRNKAIFGINAFATEAGIHQAGMLRNPLTYEYIEPARFGRERSLVVGRHSGRNILRFLMRKMNLPSDSDLVEELYERYIANRAESRSIELAELRSILDARVALAEAAV